MSHEIGAGRIRLKVVKERKTPAVDVLTSASPKIWRGNDLSVEVGIFEYGHLGLIDNIDQITVTVRPNTNRLGSILMQKTVSYADLNRTLTEAQWDAKVLAHATVNFTKDETRLDLGGANEKAFWLVIHGLTTSVPAKEVTFGHTVLTVVEDGSGSAENTPVVGANLIPAGATYDIDGNYSFASGVVNKVYEWTRAQNDATIINDTQTFTETSRFTALVTTFTLTGTPSALVTATLREPAFYTAQESDARFAEDVDLIQLQADIDAAQADATQALTNAAAAHGDWFTAASEAAMLALAANKGDRCVRTDLSPNRMYQLSDDPATNILLWKLEPVSFRWLTTAWSSLTTYDFADALVVGVDSVISQQASNLNNDPTVAANVGPGLPWGYLARGSSLQLSSATPQIIQVGAAGSSGTGAKAARDDHKHPAPPVATWTADGFEAKEDNKRFDLSEIGWASAKVNAAIANGNWIYVVGDFQTWDNVSSVRIAKIDKRGKVDPRFSSGTGFSVAPSMLAVLSDGSIIVGHSTATSYRGGTAAYIHRLDKFGEPIVSPSFVVPNVGGQLLAVAALTPDKIAFVSWLQLTVTDYQGIILFTEAASTQNFHYICSYNCKLLLSSRPTTQYGSVLNPRAVKLLDFCEDAYGAFTGDVDATFSSNASNGWGASADRSRFSPDGSFAIVGGTKDAYGGANFQWANGTAVGLGLLKVRTSGASSGLEFPGWSINVVMAASTSVPIPLGIDSQNRVYFTGNVTSINGTAVTAWRLYRVNSDGQGLVVFDDFNGTVNDILIVADDKILVLGEFYQYGRLPVGYTAMIDDSGQRIHHLLEPDTPIRVGTYREKFVDGAAMVPSVTNGATAVLSETATNKHSRDFYSFPYDTEKSVEFDTKLPSEWNLGAVKVKLDWFPQTGCTPSNGVVFDVQCVATGNGDNDDPTQGTAATIVDTVLTVPYHHITPAGQVNVGGTPAKGDLLHWKISRKVAHASDNAGGAVWLKGINIQYLEEAVEQTVWT